MEQIFLKVDGLKGESTSENGKEEIEVLSYSHGIMMPVTHSVSGGQRTHGRAQVQDFTINKHVDATSPVFMKYCADGTDIKNITLRHLRADNVSGKAVPLFTIQMHDVLVTSVSGGGSDQPMESISFNFSKVDWTYGAQTVDAKVKGQVATSYDIGKAKTA